jgi:hypothetical protein
MQNTNTIANVAGQPHFHLYVGNIILVGSVAIAIGIIYVFGGNALTMWNVAWKTLAKKFPATDVHKLGKKYSMQDGFYNCGGSRSALNYSFCIEIAQEGLLITGYFARRLPILIPWSEIQNVEDVDISSQVRITVNYENDRSMTFRLPKEALTVIQENVPAERLHKTSFSQLIKNRLNNPPN